jgi:predicted protein tyrosine phosphatase
VARIYVCGIDEMADRVEELRPARLVSLLPDEQQPETPLGFDSALHLRVAIDDVDRPEPGWIAPTRTHMVELMRFLRAAPPEESILLHCLAGVSRSPAAALIALTLSAPGREDEAALLLRGAAPFADPNRLMIEIADDVLGRGGRLVAARDAMAPAVIADFGCFALPRFLDGARRPR